MNIEQITAEIEKLKSKDISYVDAVIEYAQKNDIEVEIVADIIRKSVVLKAKIREDAEDLNMVEKTRRLPI